MWFKKWFKKKKDEPERKSLCCSYRAKRFTNAAFGTSWLCEWCKQVCEIEKPTPQEIKGGGGND